MRRSLSIALALLLACAATDPRMTGGHEQCSRFAPVRCAAGATAAPTFSDPVALVGWLIANSGRGFDQTDEAANANVFSPGLRAALRASVRRSRRLNEPPCGANGDIILDTQEVEAVQNLHLSAQPVARNRVAVLASFDVSGAHRDRRFMTVKLGGVWKVENIIGSDGASLRRLLDCRR